MAANAKAICPQSAFVEGKVLYKASACTDENDKSTTEIVELHIRTVQMRAHGVLNEKRLTAFAWQKIDGVTWGKKSSKTGDYGWLPNADPYYRVKIVAGESMPSGIGTTKLAAWQSCLKSLQGHLRGATDRGYDEEGKAEIVREMALIERRITAERKAGSAKKKGPPVAVERKSKVR